MPATSAGMTKMRVPARRLPPPPSWPCSSRPSNPGCGTQRGPRTSPSCSSPLTVYSCPSCPSLQASRFPVPDTHALPESRQVAARQYASEGVSATRPEFQSMADMLQIEFASLSAAPVGTLVVLAGDRTWRSAADRPRPSTSACKGALSRRPPRAADFTGKAKSAIEILAPRPARHAARRAARHRQGPQGAGPPAARRRRLRPDQRAQGRGRQHRRRSRRSRRGERGDVRRRSGLGALLRSYTFKKYRTKKHARGWRRGASRAGRPAASSSSSAPSRTPPPKLFAGPQGAGRRRLPRPRSRQRAGQHAGPRRVRRAHARSLARRPRGRGARRGPARSTQDGRAAGGRAGQRAPLARGRHAVARRQVQARQDAVLRRQGRVLRHRRHLHEAGRPAWRT